MMKPEFVARQSRRPTGLLGAIVARIMARETRPAKPNSATPGTPTPPGPRKPIAAE